MTLDMLNGVNTNASGKRNEGGEGVGNIDDDGNGDDGNGDGGDGSSDGGRTGQTKSCEF